MDEFQQRFKAAQAIRTDRLEQDGFEVYKFCFNGREDEWTGKGNRGRDPEEIFADIVAIVAEEFYGELFNTMFPENSPWVEFETGVLIPEDDTEQVLEIIKAREKLTEKAIKSSNFYDEGPTSFQDAVLGNVAIWGERYHLNAPVTWEAVPCSELYLRLGPFGIEDRFRKKKYMHSDLPQLFPGAKFPKKIADKIKAKSMTKATVIHGFWRDHEDPGNPIWLQRIRVDDEEIGLDKELGPDGSMPLIVGRFNAVPLSPWGVGPARKTLPTLRTLDELVRMNLEAMDHKLDPPFFYPHDGFIDLSEGLEAGIGYPTAPGTAENIKEMLGGDLDYGFFTEEKIEERVRHAFYREVVQKGKTPPSASQFIGEEQKQVRRMARPAGKTWNEFGVGVLKRTEWLESEPGGALDGLEPILVDDRVVTLRPISPLERAQAREEVLTAQSILAIAMETVGPEQTALLVDGPATIGNIKKKLKDEIVQVRSNEEIMQIIQASQPQQQEPNEQPQS